MKATEQYFPVVLFIMLYKVVQTFEPVLLSLDENLLSYSVFFGILQNEMWHFS